FSGFRFARSFRVMISVESTIPQDPPSPYKAPVRRLPIGTEPQPDGGVHFRLWAPRCREIAVEIEGLKPTVMEAEANGYFSCYVRSAQIGMRYRFRLDRGDTALPDPASRFQPEGPHGPSMIIAPDHFAWSDQSWRGTPRERLVIYELHI